MTEQHDRRTAAERGTAAGDGTTDQDTTDERAGDGMSRRGLLRAGAALGAAPVVASAAGAADAAIGDGPQGIHVAYGADPGSMVSIAFTGGPGGGSVRYGEPGELDTTVSASGLPVPGRNAIAYTATLTGLAADTEYAYEVTLNGTTSRQYRFETAPRDTGSDGFTVTQVGDHGIADPENPGQRANTDDPELVMALAEAQDPAFQLLSGDISYSNGKPSTWELYFDTFESFYAETPFMTVPGNHEAEVGTGLTQYDRRLNDAMPIPGTDVELDPEHKRRWWDFVYDNTLFVGLNTTADACGDLFRAEEHIPLYDPRCETEQGLTYGELQEQYLRETLARAAARDDVKWKIVQFHGPLWTTSPDHQPRRDLQERWGPIFDEYDVDLVLHGDNHVFERTKPITHTEDLLEYARRRAPVEGPNDEAPPSPSEAAADLDLTFDAGTTFVVNGSGGTSHYNTGTREAYIESMTDDYFGITRLDIDDTSIDVQYIASPDLSSAYNEDGTLPDNFDPENDNVEVVESFSIVKTDAGRPTQSSFVSDPASPAPTLEVAGNRTDDGGIYTGGQTNQITLELTDANDPVELRDVIPVEWNVVAGDVEREADGSVHTEPGPDGMQYVYLDADPATAARFDYFVEAPSNLEDTGEYTFGPFEARGTQQFADEGWQTVAGTSSTERVLGTSTNLGF